MTTRPFATAELFAFATALTGDVSRAQQATKVSQIGALFNGEPNLDDIADTVLKRADRIID